MWWTGGIGLAIAMTGAVSGPAPAQQGSGAMETLSQCVVARTNGEDRVIAARFVIAGMAAGPRMADLTRVDSAKLDEAGRKFAALFTRLLTRDCLMQTRAASTGDHVADAFRVAGEAIGRIAVQELLNDPAASAKLGEFTQYLNKDDFKVLDAH